jgi:hypothetical protein
MLHFHLKFVSNFPIKSAIFTEIGVTGKITETHIMGKIIRAILSFYIIFNTVNIT